jgi:DNA repair protein RecO (recombination protein O)
MQAIILKKNIFSEGNEIITMYTRELGKVRAVARSIKSPKSKLSFGLQNLFHTDVDILLSKNLSTIKGVKAIETFTDIYSDPAKAGLALYAAEIILKSTPDEQPNPQLFDLFLSFLQHLNSSSASNHHCADFFALEALAVSGYALDFKNCVICGKDLAAEQKIFFSNRKSGFVCAADAAGVSDAGVISNSIYSALASNRHDDFDQLDRLDLSKTELRRLAQSFAEHILERNLNAADYLGTL